MKVKELIEKLQKLNPDKEVWIAAVKNTELKDEFFQRLREVVEPKYFESAVYLTNYSRKD